MRIAICDDDINFINTIEKYIDKHKRNIIDCDEYQSGEELVYAYKENQERYDVIFLDMEMEQLNGIETANLIRTIDERVIIVFITSHTEYMRESFKCSPFRFLVKPVDEGEFKDVLRDIRGKISAQRKVYAFSENKAKIRLYCDDIIYCESQDHWVMIHTKEKTYKICKSLNDVYEQLDPEMFCRVHKSFVINLFYIKSIKDNDAELYHSDKLIPISRSYKKDVIKEYTDFLERDLRV